MGNPCCVSTEIYHRTIPLTPIEAMRRKGGSFSGHEFNEFHRLNPDYGFEFRDYYVCNDEDSVEIIVRNKRAAHFEIQTMNNSLLIKTIPVLSPSEIKDSFFIPIN